MCGIWVTRVYNTSLSGRDPRSPPSVSDTSIRTPGSGLSSMKSDSSLFRRRQSCAWCAPGWRGRKALLPCRAQPVCASLVYQLGTHKPVTARLWPWLEPFSVRTCLKLCIVTTTVPPGGRAAPGARRGGMAARPFPNHTPHTLNPQPQTLNPEP